MWNMEKNVINGNPCPWRIQVLGAVTLFSDRDHEIEITQRMINLLAYLATQPDMSAPALDAARLLDIDDATLRKYVSQLRQAMGPVFIPNASAGRYRLNLPVDRVDCQYFQHLVKRAETEDLDQRVKTLREALDLWREDTPLRGISRIDLGCEVKRLTDMRKRAQRRLEQVESELDRRVLQECPRPLTSGQGQGSRLGALSRQLPGTPSETVGRNDELQWLRVALKNGGLVVALSGPAGVGKTHLALTAAKELQDSFPEGAMYINLHGYSAEAVVDSVVAMGIFLEGLGISTKGIAPVALPTRYRVELSARSMLLILDNARDANHIRPLLPGATSSTLVVTSRDKLVSLDDRKVTVIALEPLPVSDAIALLEKSMGRAPQDDERAVIGQVVERCARLPLAIKVLAGRMRLCKSLRLTTVLTDLNDVRTRLMVLGWHECDLDLQTVLSWSRQNLSQGAATLFAILGAHPGPTISPEALDHLCGHRPHARLCDLPELLNANMLTELPNGRFTFHDVLRAYATQCASELDNRAEIEDRAVEYLLHHTVIYDKALESGRTMRVPAWPADLTRPVVSDQDEAMDWFDAEYPTILAAIDLARGRGLDYYVWALPMTLVVYQRRHGCHHTSERLLERAVDAAQRSASPIDRAAVVRMLGAVRFKLEKHDEAIEALTSAIAIAQLVEGEDGLLSMALADQLLGLVYEEQSSLDEAQKQFAKASERFGLLNDLRGLAHALHGLGRILRQRGEFHGALASTVEANTLIHTVDDSNEKAAIAMDLGHVYRGLGADQQAAEGYRSAIDLYHRLGYASNEARARLSLSRALRTLGREAEANDELQITIELYKRIADPRHADITVYREACEELGQKG